MTNKARTNRPTTATPRKVGTRRYLHVSAPVTPVTDKDGNHTGKFQVGPGATYRRERP